MPHDMAIYVGLEENKIYGLEEVIRIELLCEVEKSSLKAKEVQGTEEKFSGQSIM